MKENEHVTLPDGRKLGFAEYGDPQGIPVLFFHGWPSSRFQAAYLDHDASKRGIRLLAPDRPGVGLSDPMPDRRFGDWPKDVGQFADSLGIDRFRIFGVSGGGPYTLATCEKLGDRVIRAAVICGAPPLADKADRSHMHWAYRTLSGLKSLRRASLPVLLPFSRWMIDRGVDHAPMSWMLKSIPEADREAIHSAGGWDMVIRSYLEAIRNGPGPTLDDGELYLAPWDFEPERIHVPVHFWHGMADANLPCDVAKRLAARVPKAEGTWLEGEGHYSLPVRHSCEALDWLKGSGQENAHAGVSNMTGSSAS
ncbi:alpha/beta hydrolase [Haloferula helveola]|uniref:Alpha/beta hydrolase n=1 Tax=Haloferula helveola TaxID=490095 RepID=A0ABM7R9Z2_9BACT|nr:alpha/beta hydrolase [Haloferula helveola]